MVFIARRFFIYAPPVYANLQKILNSVKSSRYGSGYNKIKELPKIEFPAE
jgi:hypothetical protein